MSDSKHLKSLGSQNTKYELDEVNPSLLETFDNQHSEALYLVPFVQDRDEFTSLCPKTGQPDHARMEIVYIPRDKMIESKSLKLYLFSFRNSGEFHEDVCNRIANDLVKVLDPLYLRVYGNFAMRGGLAIRPIIERWNISASNKDDMNYAENYVRFLVNSFDLKNK